MRSFMRHLLFVLISLAVAGASVQAARATSISPAPCAMMMAAVDAGHDAAVPPCKAVTTDCVKKIGCISDTGLPARHAAMTGTSCLHEVGYWVAGSSPHGLVHQPEPLPPRMI